MHRGRVTARVVAAAAFFLLGTAPAYADAGKIAADLRDGKLDGAYSAREIQTFMEDAMTQGYGNPVEVVVVRQPTAGVAGERRSEVRRPAGTTEGERALRTTAPARTLPFTGLDLALMTGGGLLLVALGLAARRIGRPVA